MDRKQDTRTIELKSLLHEVESRYGITVKPRQVKRYATQRVLPKPKIQGHAGKRKSLYDRAWAETIRRIAILTNPHNNWSFKKIRKAQGYVRDGQAWRDFQPVFKSLSKTLELSLKMAPTPTPVRPLEEELEQVQQTHRQLLDLRKELNATARKLDKQCKLIEAFICAKPPEPTAEIESSEI